ncbi:Proteasome subunit beta type-1 [Clydaea vesicula]|uniref:Proteasome subunit beta n=1 Tax=Clydaea vesicula TaxID=447962 RepID=A0AAD5U866_9FUNG|nr:Proteasome subunit beta type-1 [Clydaea vesicula]KAJ3396731.1 Proteasome subunit beta type-1 [Lobulomyces angularis]
MPYDPHPNHEGFLNSVGSPIQHRFNPHTDNGGTTLAIAGKDFCLVAGDTRQSEGYSINTRYAPKVHELSNGSVLATSGMYADSVNLVLNIETRLEWYKHKHNKTMSATASAQMLMTVLYQKRFFPYYVFNILGGVDEKGEGCVFSYDPVGCYRRETYQAHGSSAALIQPFLDNQCGAKHQNIKEELLTLDQAMKITKDAFASATERDIYTGDYLEIFVIKKSGVTKHKFDLKKD